MLPADPGATVCRELTLALVALCVGWSMPSAVPADEPVLEEIIITARRRPQNLYDAPASISVYSETRIRDTGTTDMFDVATQEPTLQVIQNTGPLNTGFRIRRIGNEPNIPTFEPAVGLFVDKVLRSRSGVATGDLFDLERIEVVRGPQTSLYGKNTTAGVIHLISKRPTKTWEAFAEARAGILEGWHKAPLGRLEAAVSGPLSGSWSARLSGAFLHHGALLGNLLNDQDSNEMTRFALRGQLLWEPTSNFSARLILAGHEVGPVHAGDLDLDPGISIRAINDAFGVPCPSKDPSDRATCMNHAGEVEFETLD
ncbi:MAG TPA: TonB-dependent receptor plug domain-containing protein, partial [Xanthomonadales bacterium]|nr:TonB-dependent receptor plug domain-containing protein [Xanthomonadales bacterium]